MTAPYACVQYSVLETEGGWVIATYEPETGHQGFVWDKLPFFLEEGVPYAYATMEQAYEQAWKLNTSIATNPDYRPAPV